MYYLLVSSGILLHLIIQVCWAGVITWNHREIGDWPKEFPACSGASQSPIDIVDKKSVFKPSLGEIKFHNYDNKLAAKQSIINTGRSVQVNVEGDIRISGGGLPGVYKLAQYHFHWGDEKNKSSGSEHTHNGKTFPAELHLVHYNTKYDSITEAADKPEGLAVLGIWMKIGRIHEPLEDLISSFDAVKQSREALVMSSPMRLLDLLPANMSTYYRYEGSLTTPPCYESVVWTMFKQPIKLSYSQLSRFYELETVEGDMMINNYRLPLSLNKRTVYCSTPVIRTRPPWVRAVFVGGMGVLAFILGTMYYYSSKTHKKVA